MATYNINELLDLKKHLEEKLNEHRRIERSDLVYEKTERTDYTNPDNNKEFETRERVSVEEYTKKHRDLLDELAKVNIAVKKYNAEEVIELLEQREAARNKYQLFKTLKANLPKQRNRDEKVTRTDSDGRTVEVETTITEPMFDPKKVDELLDETAAEERKLNAKIQLKNLQAEVTL